MRTRKFPIQLDSEHRQRHRIPWIWWEIAEQAYAQYVRFFGDLQSIDRIAERGGFSVIELDFFLCDYTSAYPLFHGAWPPDEEPWERAAGDMICDRCKLTYHDHPPHPVDTFLTRLCGGSLVKL